VFDRLGALPWVERVDAVAPMARTGSG